MQIKDFFKQLTSQKVFNFWDSKGLEMTVLTNMYDSLPNYKAIYPQVRAIETVEHSSLSRQQVNYTAAPQL